MRKREIERVLKKYGDEPVNLAVIRSTVANDLESARDKPEERQRLKEQLRVIDFLRRSVRLKTLRMFLVALDTIRRDPVTNRIVDAVRRELVAYCKATDPETSTEINIEPPEPRS
jgi:hypothetical protein